MYFINRSKLEEPCPFIVACYNLGDRKDHDLELAMHTASSKHSVRKQLTHFSIWTLAMPPPLPSLRRLNLLAHSVYFVFLRWRSLPIRRRSFLLYMLCACTQFFFYRASWQYHLYPSSFVYVMHFPICIGHLICTRVYRLKWRALATASAAGDGASSAGCRRRAYAAVGGHWYVRC